MRWIVYEVDSGRFECRGRFIAADFSPALEVGNYVWANFMAAAEYRALSSMNDEFETWCTRDKGKDLGSIVKKPRIGEIGQYVATCVFSRVVLCRDSKGEFRHHAVV